MERQQPDDVGFPDVVYHPVVEIDSSAKLTPGVTYSEVEFPDVVYHPVVEIDSSAKLTPGVTYGRGEFAGAVVPPEVAVYGGDAFILRVVPPAGKGPDEIAADLKPLFVALVACEAALGGTGLRFDPVPGGSGAVAFCVSTTEPASAADRVRVLADIVNNSGAGGRVPNELADRVRQAANGYPVTAVVG